MREQVDLGIQTDKAFISTFFVHELKDLKTSYDDVTLASNVQTMTECLQPKLDRLEQEKVKLQSHIRVG